ncbi:MAG: N-acetyl sugar amidotransferase [Gaiellaceae bacterium]
MRSRLARGREVRYCTRCIMPDSRPRVVFDDDGVCNACRHAEQKDQIDWEARTREFLELIEPFRSTDGSWDCVVPWSGGKDSSSIAWRLKFDFGLNPLLVTFSPLLVNDVGAANREELIRAGFDHVFFRPDQRVHRHLARRFFIERGNPKVAWDAGVNAVPVKFATKLGIRLVFYAEHGESEYGGRVLSEEHQKIRDMTEVIEHQIGDDPSNWLDDVVTRNDLNPYVYPDAQDVDGAGVQAFYFGWFFRWSMLENYRFISEKIDFHKHSHGRTPGTFTDFDSLDDKSDNLYYYLQYVKFGFGRAVRDACRMIQNDQMTRDGAVELAHRYDGEFPEEFLDDMLDYLSMERDELEQVIDLHRNTEIWAKEDAGWRLRYPVK